MKTFITHETTHAKTNAYEVKQKLENLHTNTPKAACKLAHHSCNEGSVKRADGCSEESWKSSEKVAIEFCQNSGSMVLDHDVWTQVCSNVHTSTQLGGLEPFKLG